MKKYLKVSILILILGGIVIVWKTGGACETIVSFSMEKYLQESEGNFDPSMEHKFQGLHDNIVPSICSKDQFEKAKNNKWTSWYKQAEEQANFKRKMME